MMSIRAALTFFLLLAHARAQETSDLRSLPRRFATDEWQIWTSPFRKNSYSAQSVKKYVIPFVLISGALIASDRKTADRRPIQTISEMERTNLSVRIGIQLLASPQEHILSDSSVVTQLRPF